MKKIVLMYHDIIPDQDYSSGMHVPASDTYKLNNMKFEEHVAAIRDYLDKNNLPSESVEFTFDDGGYTFLTEAAPILEKYGFKGVFFVTTSFIDQDGFLTSAQVKELSTRGHVVGSHSHWHNPEMMKKSAEENRQEWQMSVEKLKSIIDEPILTASLPRGDGPCKVKEMIYTTGVKDLYTSIPTTTIKELGDGKREIGRYVIHRDLSTKDVMKIVTSGGLRKKMYLKWKVISIVKGILGDNYMKFKMLIVKQ